MPASRSSTHSLFGEILDWMLAPLLLLWPMSLGLTGLVAQQIANLPYDRELGDGAAQLARHLVVSDRLGPNGLPSVRFDRNPALEMFAGDDVDTVYFQVLGVRGELLAGHAELPVPESQPPVGEPQFRDATVHDEPVRVAAVRVVVPGDPGRREVLVQKAETLQKRSRLAAEIIKGVILPQFIILPVAVALVWLALTRGIRPLSRLQARIHGRDSGDLSPIDERDAPEEVVPLVRSINALLERLSQSIAAQKHFLADAAHQLKTPLAGLRMQAELIEREIDEGQRDPEALKASLHAIALSSQRAAHSVNQLLSMARAEDLEAALQPKPLDFAEVTQEAVRDLVPKAFDKRIDLGYEGAEAGSDGVQMRGQPVLLGELVRNLVDNALQYTPAGGTVTTRVTPDPFGQVIVLEVEDSGPGIVEAERDAIFQPFYRTLGTGVDGTGLGLAIVREIADRHEASIDIDDVHPRSNLPPGSGPGARFTVRLPTQRTVDHRPPEATDGRPVHGPLTATVTRGVAA